MGLILGTLATLGSIAMSLGLSKAMETIDSKKTTKTKTTPADISGVVNMMLSEARTKGNSVLNKLMTKLNALPSNFTQSSEIKKLIQEKRKALNEKANSITDMMNKIENNANPLNEKINALSYSSDSYRASKAGQQQFNDIKQQAGNIVSDANKLIEGVEKHV